MIAMTIWLIAVTLIATALAVEVVRLSAKVVELRADLQNEIFKRRVRVFGMEDSRE